MKRLFTLLLLLILGTIAANAQGNTIMRNGAGAPTGGCSFIQLYTSAAGNFYACPAGTWVLVSGGAAGSAAFNTITTGTNTGATMTVGTGGILTFSGSGSINANKIVGTSITATTGTTNAVLSNGPMIATPSISALTLSDVTGSTQCLHANSSGVVTGSGSDCGTGGGGVTSLTGDGVLISNSGSTGAVTLTLGTAATNTIWGRAAGLLGYAQLVNAQITNATIDLTTKVTGILPSANGGTANAFFTVSGPASSAKTYSFPNVSTTILTTNAAVTVAQGGTGAATAAAALINLFPVGTRAGDLIYCATYAAGACTSWAAVAGNNSGTQYLQENVNGVPSFSVPTGLLAGLTAGYLPEALTSTTVGNSCVDQGVTTSNQLTVGCSAGMAVSDGSGAATYIGIVAGTTQPAVAGAVGLQGPASVATQYNIIPPGAPATGLLLGTSSGSGATAKETITYVTALPNGTTATTQSANDNSTKAATTAYVDTAVSGGTSGVSRNTAWCDGTATSSTTIFLRSLGSHADTCTITSRNGGLPITSTGTVQKLYLTTGTVGKAGDKVNFQVTNTNGTRITSLTCTYGTGTTCNDTSHTWGVAAGDVLSAYLTTTGTDTTADVNVGYEMSGASTSNAAITVGLTGPGTCSTCSVAKTATSTTFTPALTNDFGSQGATCALGTLACGTINSSSCVYNATAGSACAGSESGTLVATSVADSSKTGTVTVNITGGGGGGQMIVQQSGVMNDGSGMVPTTLTLGGNLTIGNSVVVLTGNGFGGDGGTITDGCGNTYTTRQSSIVSGFTRASTSINIGCATNTITFTPTFGSQHQFVYAIEVSGATAYDTGGNGTNSSGACATGSFTVANANSGVYYGFNALVGFTTPSSTGTPTLSVGSSISDGGDWVWPATNLTTTTGSKTPGLTGTGASGGGCVAVVLAP